MPSYSFLNSVSLHRTTLVRNPTVSNNVCSSTGGQSVILQNNKRSRVLNLVSKLSTDTPTLVFITPDGITREHSRAIRLCKHVLGVPSTIVQIRDTTAKQEDISELIINLLDAGLPASRLVANGLSYATVCSLHDDLGFHMKERDAVIETETSLNKNVTMNIDHSKRLIGCAIHSVEAASAALNNHNFDYLQVGTMFKTLTHPGKLPEGPQLLKKIKELDDFLLSAKGTKLIGVGGVNFDNACTVMEYGADGVAMIRTISNADDPGGTTKQLMIMLKRAYYFYKQV